MSRTRLPLGPIQDLSRIRTESQATEISPCDIWQSLDRILNLLLVVTTRTYSIIGTIYLVQSSPFEGTHILLLRLTILDIFGLVINDIG